MRHLPVFLALPFFTACLEPQPAPDLETMASTDFTVTTVQAGLSAPWSVTPVPGAGYLVTERGGTLFRIDGPNARTEITGLPTDIYNENQAGLFDVVVTPDFATSGEVFISYAYGTADANGTALFRARIEGDALVGGETIFRASPPKDTGAHFGGRIAFLPDNTLVLTGGDGFTYREKAQDLSSPLGKIYRLNRDGSIPSDNPFVDQTDAFKAVYSYGHRNVQGAHFDGATETLWTHEHGPRGGDELNIVKKGANYGWPLATTGTDYNGAKVTPHKTLEGAEPFVKDWVPSIAPSGLTIYRGSLFPDWVGDALIGGLASGDLRRVDLEDGRAVGETKLLSGLDARIRDVRVDRDGGILVVIDDPSEGRVIRLTPKR